MTRKAERIRDRIMKGLGTSDPFATEKGSLAIHYRKPLNTKEINQMKGVQ